MGKAWWKLHIFSQEVERDEINAHSLPCIQLGTPANEKMLPKVRVQITTSTNLPRNCLREVPRDVRIFQVLTG